MNWWAAFIALLVLSSVGLIIGGINSKNEEHKKQLEYVTLEFQNCLAAHETEYLCKTYLAALIAGGSR